MLRPKKVLSLFLFVLCLMLPFPLGAQVTLTTATITGRVLDESGAVIAGASVSASQAATGQNFATQSDNQGRFRFAFLPVGKYEIRAQASGFQDAVQRAQLTLAAAFDLTLRLAVSQATVNVRVIDSPPVIETDRSQIGETIDQSEIGNVPYEGRNYLDLALLAPGVSPTNTASTQTLAETSEAVGQGYSIDSQRNFSNSFIVDGLSANDDAAGVVGNVFGMDAVSEFQVVTSGGQAEFGRATAGYFNLITRGGTNFLHGTVYGFLRNQQLNADNALSGSKLPLTQDQYGASLGGPIRQGSHIWLREI